ncbi:MAG: hypothetical protein AAF206_29490 [Bacteroidota bacterium]
MANQIVTVGSIGSWTEIASAMNAELNQLGQNVSQVIGADISGGAGSIFLTTTDGGKGYNCKVAIWSQESGDDLEQVMTSALNNDNFDGCQPLALSTISSSDKWIAMLVYFMEGGPQGVDYTVFVGEDSDPDKMDSKILTHVNAGDDQPVLYAFCQGDGGNRGVLLYSEPGK